jgi:putative ABC transport system ATP-binding protein
MNEGKLLLEARDLWKSYKRGSETIHAIAGIDISLYSGEMIGIVGRSGSGKTTLLNQIGCLDAPTRGSLKIDGREVTSLQEKELVEFRRDHIGFIFQLFYLIPTLTVRENVELPLLFARKRDPDRVADILQKVGLERNANVLPTQLNGGDMQRVAIARALVNNPEILLADEPTGRLEHRSRDAIIDLFRQLQSEGLAVIIATHDLNLSARTDRVLELKDGQIVDSEESYLFAANAK